MIYIIKETHIMEPNNTYQILKAVFVDNQKSLKTTFSDDQLDVIMSIMVNAVNQALEDA